MNASNTEADTEADVRTLLCSLRAGDRVDLGGDRWKVLSTKTNDRGTPFVTLKARTGYHPGTKTIKPGSDRLGAVVTHTRGLGSYYPRIELVARHRTR